MTFFTEEIQKIPLEPENRSACCISACAIVEHHAGRLAKCSHGDCMRVRVSSGVPLRHSLHGIFMWTLAILFYRLALLLKARERANSNQSIFSSPSEYQTGFKGSCYVKASSIHVAILTTSIGRVMRCSV